MTGNTIWAARFPIRLQCRRRRSTSRTDGIYHWRNCLEKRGAFHRKHRGGRGSHCGLGHHPAAAYAIADRLSQPEGKWKKFDQGGAKALFFLDPGR
jgi:hypothetical protein